MYVLLQREYPSRKLENFYKIKGETGRRGKFINFFSTQVLTVLTKGGITILVKRIRVPNKKEF